MKNKRLCKDCLWSSWDPHVKGIVLVCRRHDFEKLMGVRTYRKYVEETCETFRERPAEEERGQWTAIKVAEAMDIQRRRGEPISSLTCMEPRTSAAPLDPVSRHHAAREKIERRKREQQSIEQWLDGGIA